MPFITFSLLCHRYSAGSVLGESEKKTNAILDATLGSVLVIDEAYGLHSKAKAVDPYKVGKRCWVW
jgi:hypothetical protein